MKRARIYLYFEGETTIDISFNDIEEFKRKFEKAIEPYDQEISVYCLQYIEVLETDGITKEEVKKLIYDNFGYLFV